MTPELFDEVLEALDLSRAAPGSGFLEALYSRFNARVPFETASKILRHAAVAAPEEKPRRPGLFWREHLDRGAGGTCFARVAAFDALLVSLGFRTRRLLGRVLRDFDHAALAVATPDGEVLCDVGFPLPSLLPLAPGERETPLGAMTSRASPRGLAIELGGVPEGPRNLEIFLAEVPPGEYERLWRATFRDGSKFLTQVSMRLQPAERVVSFVRGEIRVDDLHARLTVPLVAARRSHRLSEVFGIDAALLDEAFALAGAVAPDRSDATLTAYLETAAEPERAFAAIADLDGYRRLLEGVARVAASEAVPGGFRFVLAPPDEPAGSGGAARLEERVLPDASRQRVTVRREAGASRLDGFYEVLAREGKAYLVRGATLAGPREDLLRNDSLRGRLAGSLAVDLLAWARLLAGD